MERTVASPRRDRFGPGGRRGKAKADDIDGMKSVVEDWIVNDACVEGPATRRARDLRRQALSSVVLVIPVPDFATHYYLPDRRPFLSLSDLPPAQAGGIVADLMQRRASDPSFKRVFGRRYMQLREL